MARRRVICAVAASGVFAFCALATAGNIWWGKKPLTPAQRKLVATAVKAQLKDPDSAKFKWVELDVEATDTPDLRYYCGFINAKNSFGGYVGYHVFLVLIASPDSHTVAALQGIDDGSGNTSIATTCTTHGYSLTPPA